MTFININNQLNDFLMDVDSTTQQATANLISELEDRINTDLYDTLLTAQSQFEATVNAFQDIRDRFDTLLGYLVAPSDYKNAIEAFGLTLAVSSGVQASEWDRGNGVRVREVYDAITAIINKLASEYAADATVTDDHRVEAILLFQDAFGGVQLTLTNGENPANSEAYATTNNTSSITLWLDPSALRIEDQSQGYPVYTGDNLIHEFGHVLDFRVASVNGNLYADWEPIRLDFSRFTDNPCRFNEDGTPVYGTSSEKGFTLTDGFVNGDSRRQNRQPRSDFASVCGAQVTDEEICSSAALSDNSLCQEFEIERITDMFLYWVRDYGFTQSPDLRGPAMDAYVNGVSYVRSNNETVSPTGFFSWIVIVAEGV